MSDASMEIDIDHVLWRTRGARWDYTFMLRPALDDVDSWYELHTKIFAGVTPLDEEQESAGVLADDEGKLKFAATTFVDGNRRDAAGRQIAHYFVWIEPPSADDRVQMPAGWGRQLLSSFEPVLDAVFDAAAESKDLEDTVAREAALLPKSRLEGEVREIPARIELRIKKKLPLPTPRRSSNRAWMLVVLTALVLLMIWLMR